ncbi:chromosome partitioning ATPase [Parazoarcus communis]|uniref:non-specific protein-tyrosine kinase n=1 Tax=Parazoarcus communis TaxID=41977 RepID=A0A2U8H4J2_9RHOO|nr:XrtA-associated tyrosine autokinase [Parazoarcus communis]AWI79745.1 chromosome partitioning ATPase [Parazoarcus communis]
MSLIEKAVQRLDALKQASGVEEQVAPTAERVVTEVAHDPVADAGRTSSSVPLADPVPTPNPSVSRDVRIDLQRLGAMGMVTPDVPRAAIAEEFRLIKRPLLRNATVSGPAEIENGSLIMVTSAMPGEGKSFTAINLAISMAMELDYTVLLVDADVSRPSVLNRLGLPPERGLMDVLSGEVSDLGDVLLRTNIEKLSILPAGMPHPRATEMLASESMNRLLEQIANRYADRIIVFDSPPLLVTTEARVLATHMGQVVIVVEAGRTTHATVKQALATIENCPVKLMVLNKSRENAAGSYYGYGYGYGAEPRSEAA